LLLDRLGTTYRSTGYRSTGARAGDRSDCQKPGDSDRRCLSDRVAGPAIRATPCCGEGLFA